MNFMKKHLQGQIIIKIIVVSFKENCYWENCCFGLKSFVCLVELRLIKFDLVGM